MDRNEASSVIRRYLTCTDITHSCNGKCEKCRYHTSDEEKELALKLAIAALEGKDTDVPANSALDHIHNVVMDDAYKRGYEQGKAEKAPAIIRCRDCKYSIDEYNDGDCYCKRPSRELVWIGKSWDFFCKAGAKREGEADG